MTLLTAISTGLFANANLSLICTCEGSGCVGEAQHPHRSYHRNSEGVFLHPEGIHANPASRCDKGHDFEDYSEDEGGQELGRTSSFFVCLVTAL